MAPLRAVVVVLCAALLVHSASSSALSHRTHSGPATLTAPPFVVSNAIFLAGVTVSASTAAKATFTHCSFTGTLLLAPPFVGRLLLLHSTVEDGGRVVFRDVAIRTSWNSHLNGVVVANTTFRGGRGAVSL